MTPTTDDYDQDRIQNDQVNIANAELHVSKMRKAHTHTVNAFTTSEECENETNMHCTHFHKNSN